MAKTVEKLEVNVEYANTALLAMCGYKADKRREQPSGVYVDGQFKTFKFEEHDISDCMASLLHLAQQLKNEGEDVDPERVWDQAWVHFEAEALNPDDIEEGRRQMAAQDEKAVGRLVSAAARENDKRKKENENGA